MKVGPIAVRLRVFGVEEFGDNIAGAAELDSVQNDTLTKNTAYVVQLGEVGTPNDVVSDVSQVVTESFGVIVAIRNDQSQGDKTSLTAFDQLFNIRKQLFNALVGWEIDDEDPDDGFYAEGPIYYKGGDILDINPAWMWFLYEFEYKGRLQGTMKDATYIAATNAYIAATNVATPESATLVDITELNTISTQYVLTPSSQIPITGNESLPNAVTADLEQIIDLTRNLDDGAFVSAFATGFDLYKG